ncbi:ATP-dependent DNA helicase DinG [Oceanospirillum sanctuarii]|uniref:ATP-dependent DNA helicase DinG n=1 Tax=Oceanospirillum sanctuarii TaxID=1434821 RepID=UPI000A3ACD54|nr:ATP-dependent DNA helicase DinG [Oceanospirillum sanctuarii]
MLTDAIKSDIQSAYSTFLKNRKLRARHGQRLMVAQIARTLGNIQTSSDGVRTSGPHVCAIEAGTGTGKTLAYLVSSLPVAKERDKRIVVSTATVALQEQLIFKDLPDLQKHAEIQFKYALAKGRSRYLCLSRLEQALEDASEAAPAQNTLSLFDEFLQANTSKEATALYQEMAQHYLSGKWEGDRDSWKDSLEEPVWRRITTDHNQCTNRRCSNFSSCAFFKARNELDGADIIVANHDLVLADLSLGGGIVLPDPQDTIYIFDEGHHLPDKAIDHFAGSFRVNASLQWLRLLKKSLPDLNSELGQDQLIVKQLNQLPEILNNLEVELAECYRQLHEITQFSPENMDKDIRPVYRFENGIVPETLIQSALNLKISFASLCQKLEIMVKQLKDAMDPEASGALGREEGEQWLPLATMLHSRAVSAWELWGMYATPQAEDVMPIARWITLQNQQVDIDLEVSCSPISAAGTLARNLWQPCFGAVLSSATLTALGSFDRIRTRAGLPEDADCLVVPSPFDFASNGVLELPEEACDPTQSDVHTSQIVSFIKNKVSTDEGTLVLFSSRRQMRDVLDKMPASLVNTILVQDDLTKQVLLDRHRSRIDKDEGSIIFGLASFAEGIDLPGKYLSHVVITRIPFSVPDDPVEKTLSEWIEAKGGNPFLQITVPDASIRLVQAVGRLLRTESDTGKISMLDRRVQTKRYGKQLLNSLPPFRRAF